MSEETQHPEYKGHYEPTLPADEDLSSLDKAYEEGGYEALKTLLTPELRTKYEEEGYEALKELLSEGEKAVYKKGGDEAVNKLHSPEQAAADNRAAYRRALEAAQTRAQLESILKDLQPKPANHEDKQSQAEPEPESQSEFDHYTGDQRVSGFLRDRIEATNDLFNEQDSVERLFLNDIIPTINNFDELSDLRKLVEAKFRDKLLGPQNVDAITQALRDKERNLQDDYYKEHYLETFLSNLKNMLSSKTIEGVSKEWFRILDKELEQGKIRYEQALEIRNAVRDRIEMLKLYHR